MLPPSIAIQAEPSVPCVQPMTAPRALLGRRTAPGASTEPSRKGRAPMRAKLAAVIAAAGGRSRYGRVRPVRAGRQRLGRERLPDGHREPGQCGPAGRRHRHRPVGRHLRAGLRIRPGPVDGYQLERQRELEHASTSWLVKDVSVGVGDTVAKGDVLATADTASAKAALDLAKANLAVAKARLAVDKAGLTGAERAAAYDSIKSALQQLKVAKQSHSQTTDSEFALARAGEGRAGQRPATADRRPDADAR